MLPAHGLLGWMTAVALLLGTAALAGCVDDIPSPAPVVRVPASAPDAALVWEPWSAERLAQARAQGRVVFADYSADWCMTCTKRREAVLEHASVVSAFKSGRVVLLRGDSQAGLSALGRSSGHDWAVQSPDPKRAPQILPEDCTVEDVVSALRDAARGVPAPAPR